MSARASSSKRSTTFGNSASLATADTLPARWSTERPAAPRAACRKRRPPRARACRCPTRSWSMPESDVPGVVLVGDPLERRAVESAADDALKGVGGVDIQPVSPCPARASRRPPRVSGELHRDQSPAPDVTSAAGTSCPLSAGGARELRSHHHRHQQQEDAFHGADEPAAIKDFRARARAPWSLLSVRRTEPASHPQQHPPHPSPRRPPHPLRIQPHLPPILLAPSPRSPRPS